MGEKTVADMLNSIIGLAIMMAAGPLLGWRWHAGLGTALAAMGLLLLLRSFCLALGRYLYWIERQRPPDTYICAYPGVAGWFSLECLRRSIHNAIVVEAIAQWNPLFATASAIRQLFLNPGWRAGPWVIVMSSSFAYSDVGYL